MHLDRNTVEVEFMDGRMCGAEYPTDGVELVLTSRNDYSRVNRAWGRLDFFPTPDMRVHFDVLCAARPDAPAAVPPCSSSTPHRSLGRSLSSSRSHGRCWQFGKLTHVFEDSATVELQTDDGQRHISPYPSHGLLLLHAPPSAMALARQRSGPSGEPRARQRRRTAEEADILLGGGPPVSGGSAGRARSVPSAAHCKDSKSSASEATVSTGGKRRAKGARPKAQRRRLVRRPDSGPDDSGTDPEPVAAAESSWGPGGAGFGTRAREGSADVVLDSDSDKGMDVEPKYGGPSPCAPHVYPC